MKSPDDKIERLARLRKLLVDGFLCDDTLDNPDFLAATQELERIVRAPATRGPAAVCAHCKSVFDKCKHTPRQRYCSSECARVATYENKRDPSARRYRTTKDRE